MKFARLTYIATILFFAVIGINGQTTCETGSQCVKQATIDKCGQVADELIAARDVIEKFKAERTATDAERVAATVLIKSLNDVLDVRGRIIAEYDKMMVVYQKVIDMQSALIDRMTKELNKPKSAWKKFVTVLKEIAILTLGLTIGRGL